MRGLIVILAILILAVTVSASNTSLCSDTDGGGGKSKDDALKNAGQVKYGITSMSDTCLTSAEGVSTNSSKWLKEYFCDLDTRKSEVYDCTRYGFSGCVNGECIGTGSGSNQTQVTQAEPDCGNKILEKTKGEECDPPNKICFGKTSDQYGICDGNCKCKIAGAAAAAHEAVCGDDVRESSEDCEKDDDCGDDYVCSSCKCVKQLTQAEIDAMKKQGSSETEKEIEETKKEIDEKYKTPELTDVNLSAEDFSDDPGIKATSSIAGFFKSIFGWLASIFS